MNRGFTLIELLVSISIFVIMTAVVMVKYGNFNQSTLLTDTAYDVALALRLAQSYGLSVKNAGSLGGSSDFTQPYGIDFTTDPNGYPCGSVTTNAVSMTLFADSAPAGAPDGLCSASDANVTSYAITRGATVSSLCVGADQASCESPTGSVTRLDVSYERPDPEAIICGTTSGGSLCSSASGSTIRYAEVVLKGTDGSTRTIVVRENGQIDVAR